MRFVLSLSLLLGVLTPAIARAQVAVARLTVTVTDTAGEPLTGAQIRVSATEQRAATGRDGRAMVANIPAGQRLVQVRRLGYAPATLLVDFAAGADVEAEVELVIAPVALGPVETTERRREPRLERAGYYRRERSNGWGTFIGPEEMARRRRTTSRVSDLVKSVRGVGVEYRGGAVVLYSMRGGMLRGRCVLQLFIDGIRIPLDANSSRPFTIDQFITPLEVAAIEVYPSGSSAPLEFTMGSSCGAIVVWTW